MNPAIFAADIPVSPNATDPVSWGNMIVNVGIPMGILIIGLLAFCFFTYVLFHWLFGPSKTEKAEDGGILRVACTRWVDAQVAAFNGIRVDIDALKKTADSEQNEHEAQRTAHQATLAAARHGLNALDKIGIATKADIADEIRAAHESLDKT